MKRRFLSALIVSIVLPACAGGEQAVPPPAPPPPPPVAEPAAPPPSYDAMDRARFNQLAARLNLPVFWVADEDDDGAVDPTEIVALEFYPVKPDWTVEGKFTPEFEAAYARMVQAHERTAEDDAKTRAALVTKELDQGRPTLVHSDLTKLSDEERAFASHMFAAGKIIDRLYAKQIGMASMADQVASDDVESQSLFRRNWGPKCKAPKTEKEEACSAIEGAPEQLVDIYPRKLQKEDDFCKQLQDAPNAERLMDPFTVVREKDDELVAVPYTKAYEKDMRAVAAELRAGAKALPKDEAPLKQYLEAAAKSFETNEWGPADEAWAKMTSTNSKWYVRVAPDETYWEPCSYKAGFHMTFARINPDSLKWQKKLTPLQQDMEEAISDLVGWKYKARKVTFHLPDFIDIVTNSGDDRNPFGATIGQSLPNWGNVANEGRGRTVAMSNLYTDADSRSIRKQQAKSLLTPEAMKEFQGDPEAGLLGTILHEAAHNLGPSHEYRYRGKTAREAFGGPLASMLEELKAQTAALFYLDFIREKGVIKQEQQRQAYADSIVWALGHISRGMFTPSGRPKPYSQLAAIQIGYLMDEGVVEFDEKAKAANGKDAGAFRIDYQKMPQAAEKLMKQVSTIKATNDKKAAEKLVEAYVKSDKVPHETIVERFNRFPKATFVYSIEL